MPQLLYSPEGSHLQADLPVGEEEVVVISGEMVAGAVVDVDEVVGDVVVVVVSGVGDVVGKEVDVDRVVVDVDDADVDADVTAAAVTVKVASEEPALAAPDIATTS